MIRLKNKKRIYTLCSLSIVLALGLSACTNPQKETTNTNNESPTKQQDVNKNTSNNESTQKESQEKEVASSQNNNLPKFSKKILQKSEKPEFNTAWKPSESKNYSACIEGKGPEAREEGLGTVYVKDKDNNIFSFELLDDKKNSPKYVDWVDDENLFVVIGSAFGTVSKGGNLYLLNISTGKVSSVIELSDNKQEIISAQKSGSNIKLKVNIYEDDNYTKSHIENWIINSFDVSLTKKMEVKNAEGKITYIINDKN